tara:strand:+ start:350 stop:811 length:462 start_codon:yes stop_codon:yes gene_type:complete
MKSTKLKNIIRQIIKEQRTSPIKRPFKPSTSPIKRPFKPSTSPVRTPMKKPLKPNVSYAVRGCTIPSADNYNPNAQFDDGSCFGHCCGDNNPNAYCYTTDPIDNSGDSYAGISGTLGDVIGNFNPMTGGNYQMTMCVGTGDINGSCLESLGCG